MIDREVAIEALSALCDAHVRVINGGYGSSWPFSMKRRSLLLDDDFDCNPFDDGSGRAELFSIDHLVPRLLQTDRISLFEDEDKIFSERNHRVCDGLSTDETTGEIKLKIAIDQQRFFDPKHDYDFTNRKDTVTFWRGGEKYERPCGYKRFGLKVLGEYEDDTWLGRRGRGTRSVVGEWPVSYHGTKAELVDGIITGTYKAGPRQWCGRGVYSTPHISVAERERYAKTFTSKKDGKDYKVILQNRINPEYRVICEKQPKYWLIRIPEGTSEEDEKELVKRAIRPYGLLIKEVKERP